MATIATKRALLITGTETASVERRKAARPRIPDGTPIALRRRLIRANQDRDDDEIIERRKRKRSLFHEVVADVEAAERMNRALCARREAKRARMADAAAMVRAVIDVDRARATLSADEGVAGVMLRDVLLYHDGDTARQPNSTPLDEHCTNCATKMLRNASSMLRCPACGFQRAFVDSSISASAASGAYSKRRSEENDMPKACLHYLTFLAAVQVKTTKVFESAYMLKLAKFVYVQGCRDPEDITKEHTNHAQRFDGGETKHNYSILYKQLLRGRVYKFPPELTLKLLLLFRKLWPEFLVNKDKLRQNRTNMQAFKFITRCFLRMLGYPVYLRCIEPFRMKDTQLMHSSFARKQWKRLGWKWEDGRITEEWISDAMIDQYEKLQEIKLREKQAKDKAAKKS